MALATLDKYTFDISPESVQWGYGARTRRIQTKGGTVIQVLGASVNEINVSGSFGSGGYEEMETFAKFFRDLANKQAAGFGASRFTFPTRGWDAMVYLKNMPNISYSVETVNPTYAITLAVESGMDQLNPVAASKEIKRLIDGIKWIADTQYSYWEEMEADNQVYQWEEFLRTMQSQGVFTGDVEATAQQLAGLGISPEDSEIINAGANTQPSISTKQKEFETKQKVAISGGGNDIAVAFDSVVGMVIDTVDSIGAVFDDDT